MNDPYTLPIYLWEWTYLDEPREEEEECIDDENETDGTRED